MKRENSISHTEIISRNVFQEGCGIHPFRLKETKKLQIPQIAFTEYRKTGKMIWMGSCLAAFKGKRHWKDP
jgi:hypothetical protein